MTQFSAYFNRLISIWKTDGNGRVVLFGISLLLSLIFFITAVSMSITHNQKLHPTAYRNTFISFWVLFGFSFGSFIINGLSSNGIAANNVAK
jgi:hypothetical protein